MLESKSLFIIQPSFLPWFGQFAMFVKSDKVVFLDDVQYDTNGWRNRNRISTKHGIQWLTVPVLTKSKTGQLLSEVRIDGNKNWQRKILNTLMHSYSKEHYFNSIFPRVEKILNRDNEKLIDLNLDLIYLVLEILHIQKNTMTSSSICTSNDKNLRIIEICKYMKCNTYNSGNAAQKYINPELFSQSKISLRWFDEDLCQISTNIYPEYQDKLSIIDLLFKIGPENTLTFLEKFGDWRY